MKKRTMHAVMVILAFFLGMAGNAGASSIWSGWFEYGGHEYASITGGYWNEAEAVAVANGGHLVTINSQAEVDWLHTTFNIPYFIGLHRVEKNWVWTSGDPVTFTNWAADQTGWGGDYGLATGAGSKWYGAYSTTGSYGIVERTSSVPLPGAVWLLGSGLLGLGVRRWFRYYSLKETAGN